LRTAAEVERLHEMLCFMRAYPDDARTLASVNRMLKRFAQRADLRKHRDALENSGIAGCAIRFPFFWPTARWLARNWPQQLTLDRLDRAADAAIGKLFGFRSGFAALDRIRPRVLTDAVFFIRLLERMPGGSFSQEAFYDAIEPVLELRAGRGTPNRTLAWHRTGAVCWQHAPIERARPDVATEIRRLPRRVRRVAPREGARLVDLARAAMATRSRDLDAFAYGDPATVRVVEDDRGLAFALIGMIDERRKADADVYGAVTLKNGVPVGYMDLAFTGSHVEISFNTFSTYRDGEAARIFARTLAMARRVFGSATFGIGPYALGQGNREAIDSGAWWFYYRLGLRPRAAAAKRLARRELAHWRADRGYRSSRATLEKLARWPLYYRYH
ncbi:MAG: hypothetical protein ACREVG_06140, partial [Burkholderiales bacterium]